MIAPECGFEADGGVAFRRKRAALGCALEVAFLNEKRFVHFFERLGFFADGDGDRAHADGTAAIVFGHDAQHAFVHFIEAGGVDFQQLERGGGGGLGDFTLGALLSVVAAEVDEIIGDAGRAAGAGGDFLRAALVDRDAEQTATAADDSLQGRVVVVVEARLQREARAQRGGE